MDPEYPYITTGTSAANVTNTYTVYTTPLKFHKGDAYEAIHEHPTVFCSSGPTPADALRAMADLLAKSGVDTWSGASVNFDREGTHYLTIYL